MRSLTGRESERVRAEFDYGAGAIAERAGTSVLQELVNTILPAALLEELNGGTRRSSATGDLRLWSAVPQPSETEEDVSENSY